MPVSIASWNVNSVLARLPRIEEFCRQHQPDILCLQELKCTDEKFPHDAFREWGYTCMVWGQQRYNGVAVCSRHGALEVDRSWSTNPLPEQARLVMARWRHLWVASVYAPNGGEVGSSRYSDKLRWFEQLASYLHEHPDLRSSLMLTGDFNVAPEDLDVHDPTAQQDQLLTTPEERRVFASLSVDYTDSFRQLHPSTQAFSWWDYRALAFPLNKGMRIDMILVPNAMADRIVSASIIREFRKGKKPSDHAPVWVELDLPE